MGLAANRSHICYLYPTVSYLSSHFRLIGIRRNCPSVHSKWNKAFRAVLRVLSCYLLTSHRVKFAFFRQSYLKRRVCLSSCRLEDTIQIRMFLSQVPTPCESQMHHLSLYRQKIVNRQLSFVRVHHFSNALGQDEITFVDSQLELLHGTKSIAISMLKAALILNYHL